MDFRKSEFPSFPFTVKMAYVPPHKRHPKTGDAASSQPSPAPPPGSVGPRFQRKHNNNPMSRCIVFAKDCIAKWFVVGLDEDDSIKLSTFTLEPVATNSLERKSPALVPKENCEEEAREFLANPWVFIAETVKEDFAVSLQNVKNMIKENGAGVLKPYLYVRFGKVLFNGNHSSGLECTKRTLEGLRRSFYTNVPPSYMQNITNDVVPKMGLNFLEEKDLYLLILSDNTQPGSTIACKCDVIKDGNSLQLRSTSKIEVISVRHFVADMTCLDKKLDLKLILLTKRNLWPLTDEELENIKSLIGCATLDEEIKGGLKWPLGKRSLDRLNVVSVWHTNSRTFKSSSMKLKVRVADRYNFNTSEGEVAREVILKLTNIESHLGEEMLDTDVAFEMLKENLELIWKHFLF